MIEENFMLFICLVFLVLTVVIFQYIEVLNTKKTAIVQLKSLENQIAEEQNILERYNQEIVKIDKIEKDINHKLVTLKTDVTTIDFSLSEFFELVLWN